MRLAPLACRTRAEDAQCLTDNIAVVLGASVVCGANAGNACATTGAAALEAASMSKLEGQLNTTRPGTSMETLTDCVNVSPPTVTSTS